MNSALINVVKGGVALSIAASAVIFSGCGSSSGLGGALSSLSGKAADGYLVNAKVCLDVNLNGKCDGTTEYEANTTAGGNFTLQGIPSSIVSRYPLVVEAIANATEDEDNPGLKITNS